MKVSFNKKTGELTLTGKVAAKSADGKVVADSGDFLLSEFQGEKSILLLNGNGPMGEPYLQCRVVKPTGNAKYHSARCRVIMAAKEPKASSKSLGADEFFGDL